MNQRQQDEKSPVAAGQWQLIEKDRLIPREDNPRKINEKAKSFLELVESVRSAGIVTPLLGRPHPQLPGKIELLAGHRRNRAGLVAGLDHFPVVVREMDDRTALEVLVFENLDRENLTPLEEARGVDLLLRSNHEAAEIASRMGKTVQWVARRAQLLQLTAVWKKWADEREVSAAHLELVARLPKATQDELFEDLTEEGYNDLWMGAGTLKELRERIAEYLMELKGAPWAQDDALLVPKAGACSVCPKRSGCQPTLFGDPEDGGDRCLDAGCWDQKMKAHLERRKAELKKEHKGLVLVRGERGFYEPGTLGTYEYKECKQTSAGAKPALVVCGEGAGTLIWITTDRDAPKEKVKPKKEGAAAKQAQASLDPEESAKLLKEKQEAHELRRWAWVCKRLQEMIDEAEMPGQPAYQTAAGLCELVARFGTESVGYLGGPVTRWDDLDDPGGMDARAQVWEQLQPRLRATLMVFSNSQIGPQHHAAMKGAAWLMGTTVEGLKADADAEIQDPKSWEQLRKLSEAPPPPPPAKKKAASAPKKAGRGKAAGQEGEKGSTGEEKPSPVPKPAKKAGKHFDQKPAAGVKPAYDAPVEELAAWVKQMPGRLSVAIIQRELKIGYTRAQEVVEALKTLKTKEGSEKA